jgi:membrane fusion protein, multidrug efflux system
MSPPNRFRKNSKGMCTRRVAGVCVSVLFAAGAGLAMAQDRPAASLTSAAGSSPEVTARAVVRPWHEVKLAVDLSARIRTMPHRAGDRFQKGDVLIEFECARFQADLKALRAVEAEQAAQHRTNVTLRQHKAAGANEVEIARARLNKASADAESLGHRISQCKITAPFSGRVAERLTDLYEMPQAGQPLMRIVDDGELEVAMIVPAAWLRWLQSGQTLDVIFDDSGGKAAASVTRIGAAVDPASQTVEIFARLMQGTGTILPGMGGLARFRPPQG